MAIVQNTLIGRSRKSVGGTTFSTWKGLNVLKSKPITVANPESDAQLMRRSALSQIVAIFRLIPAAVNAGFKKLAVHMSPYNAWASVNLKDAFDYSAPPDATFYPAGMLISKGTIAKTEISTISSTNGSPTATITFPTTSADPGQSATDKTIAVVFNESQNVWGSATGTAVRSAGTVSVTMPANYVTGNDISYWLGFYNELSGESSDSDYQD